MIELRTGWKVRQCYVDGTPYWIEWEGEPIDGAVIWGASQVEEINGRMHSQLYVSTRADQETLYRWESRCEGKDQVAWDAMMIAAENAMQGLVRLLQ